MQQQAAPQQNFMQFRRDMNQRRQQGMRGGAAQSPFLANKFRAGGARPAAGSAVGSDGRISASQQQPQPEPQAPQERFGQDFSQQKQQFQQRMNQQLGQGDVGVRADGMQPQQSAAVQPGQKLPGPQQPDYQMAAQQWSQQAREAQQQQPWFQAATQGDPAAIAEARQWGEQMQAQAQQQPWHQQMMAAEAGQGGQRAAQEMRPATGQQMAQAQPPSWQNAQQAQNTGAQSFSAPIQPFDQNKWQAGPTSQADKDYWQWAIKEQTGNPDFWGTLKEGTVMSGSPDRVWTKSPGGQWGSMSKDDYMSRERGGMPADVPDGALYRAGDLGNERFATYDPMQYDTTGLPTYDPSQFSQFQGPNQGTLDQQQVDMYQRMLQNPETMNENVVSALQSQAREQSANALRSQQDATAGRFASMGRLGGGMQQGMNQQAAQEAQNQLLSQNRDIMLKKAQQDRIDQLQAGEAASGFQTGQMGRYDTGYRAALAGQTSQADENARGYQSQAAARQFQNQLQQQQAAENQLGFSSQRAAQDASIQRAIQQQGLNQAQAQSGMQGWMASKGFQGQDLSRALQEKLGMADIDVRNRGMGLQNDQFGRSLALDWARFGEGARQFNNQSALGWAGLGQQDFWNAINGMGSLQGR
jgi:hypothetical protein